MKLTKLSAAVMATMALAATAHAQSSVTLYGIVDGGLIYNNVKTPNVSDTKIGAASGAYLPTLWGVKGVEDLGNGNAAVFTLEGGFDVENGNSVQGGRLFGRQSTVGLRNDAWGQADVGRQSNLASKYFLSIDPFGLAWTQVGMGSSFGSANSVRYSNMLMYQTPSYAGFSGGIGYSFNTGIGAIYGAVPVADSSGFSTTNNMRATTVGLKYEKGPAKIVATYDLINPASGVPGDTPNVSSWVLGGSYDFNVVKVSAAYGQTRDGYISGMIPLYTQAINTQWSNGGILFRNGAGSNSYMVGASVPVSGASKVMVSYNGLNPTGNFADNGGAMQSVYNVGYQYDFSKRTSAYAYLSYANNYAMVNGVTSTLAAVGMTHKF